MDTIAESYEHAGVTVEIHYDGECESTDPRNNDNIGIMYCWHPNYKLGDEQFTRSDHESMEAVVQYLIHERDAICVIPLFLLDHSGLSMTAGRDATDLASSDRFVGDGAGWDTTHVGFIYTNAERVRELCAEYPYKAPGFDGTPQQWLEWALRSDVEEYDTYLRGEVYGYVLKNAAGDELDSCWGFLGHDHVQAEANEAAECGARAIKREAEAVAYWAARDVMTVAP